jgi:CheY-like chemotaxis protein
VTTPPAKNYTVLLVDDDIHNQKIFETVLRHNGFLVRMAATGDEALREARTHLPDLILMDLSIPVIDGWECSRQLKADEATRHIIILALTAHATCPSPSRRRSSSKRCAAG